MLAELYCVHKREIGFTFGLEAVTAKMLVGFTLQAKLVSSKHLTQVHLKISSRTLNLASHLMTKYILEAQTVSHLSL